MQEVVGAGAGPQEGGIRDGETTSSTGDGDGTAWVGEATLSTGDGDGTALSTGYSFSSNLWYQMFLDIGLI